MTNKENTCDQTQEAPSLTVGGMLKHSREILGMSKADVAKKLNLRVTLIDEIEHDEFSGIAAPTYIRGYLLNYANYVGLDADVLYKALDKQVNLPDVRLQSFSRKTTRQARDHRWWIVTYCLFASLLLMLCVWWVQDRNQPEHSKLSAKTVEELIVEQERSKQIQVDHAVHRVTEDAPASKAIAQLALQITQACWLEIKDAKGQFLVEGLQKEGMQLTLEGQAPFTVVMGAPENVTLYYEGQPFDLSMFSAGKVARFQIPRVKN